MCDQQEVLSFHMTRTARKRCLRQIYFAAGMYLPNCYLAMQGQIYFIEHLLINDAMRVTHMYRLMGGNFEVRFWDWLKCHDLHIKVHEVRIIRFLDFRNSKYSKT